MVWHEIGLRGVEFRLHFCFDASFSDVVPIRVLEIEAGGLCRGAFGLALGTKRPLKVGALYPHAMNRLMVYEP